MNILFHLSGPPLKIGLLGPDAPGPRKKACQKIGGKSLPSYPPKRLCESGKRLCESGKVAFIPRQGV